MNETERLIRWMDENEHSIRSLAEATGLSYDGVYQALRVRRHLSHEFKWRFMLAFGTDLALELFDSTLEPA